MKRYVGICDRCERQYDIDDTVSAIYTVKSSGSKVATILSDSVIQFRGNANGFIKGVGNVDDTKTIDETYELCPHCASMLYTFLNTTTLKFPGDTNKER